MAKNKPPIVILVRPQMGENIGAVARAMSNFGLKELRLVAPRDGWPNKKALDMASGGEGIIKKAKLYDDFPAAMQGVHFAYATTARKRDMEKRVIEPMEAISELKSYSDGGKNTALVFGPERAGMENNDIALCDTLITIPTAPENSSLNLGQSAVILGYEWRKQSGVPAPKRALPDIAPKEDWAGLFDQLEGYLDTTNFFRVPEKKPIMWQNLRNMLMRGSFTGQEIRTLRGVFRIIWEGKRRGAPRP